MKKNLYEIEKCENAKHRFVDEWITDREKGYFVYSKIREKTNLEESIKNLAASMYYTFSKVTYDMKHTSFAMFIYTRNNKWTMTPKPFRLIASYYKNPLKEFTETLNKIYPSKRPAACSIFIAYPCCSPFDKEFIFGSRPYFPCKYNGYKLPLLNNKTFKTEECQICFENPTSVLFCVCGHICICECCFKTYNSYACPICKTYNEYVRAIL